MGILIGLWQQAKQWDRPTKLAFAMALVLLLLSLAILSSQPQLRTPALIASSGLLVALQVIALWGNRHMVTPYTQAQRHFLAGDMELARDVLLAGIEEREAADKKPEVDSLVLLGNIYRNLGQLDLSLEALQSAVERRPSYHFALYGHGRSLLAAGDYDAAMQHLDAALKYGAPEIVAFDLAHVAYRRGDLDTARAYLQRTPQTDEAYRDLMLDYLQHKLAGVAPPTAELIEIGLPFWVAEVERFADTPYGQALQADLYVMQALIK